MNIGVIILARLDSSRLPGKALRDLGGKPMLGRVFDLCRRIEGVHTIALATTSRDCDDSLAELATEHGICVVRGAVSDVAHRFLLAMEILELDAAVRFNGDSPLHRPFLISDGVSEFRRVDMDLVTNVPGRTWPMGLSVEVVGRTAMKRAYDSMRSPAYKEHVTKIFYDRPASFRIKRLLSGPEGAHGINLAVDDARGLDRASWILGRLGERWETASVTELIQLAVAYETEH